jgi:hypothetical protein
MADVFYAGNSTATAYPISRGTGGSKAVCRQALLFWISIGRAMSGVPVRLFTPSSVYRFREQAS